MPNRIVPTCYETIRTMMIADIDIIASCQKCQEAFDVDLGVMAILHGIDTSLIGRHPPCRIYNCDGRCVLLVRPNEGVHRMPLDRWIKHD